MAFCSLVATYLSVAAGWNSAATLDNFYTFQDQLLRSGFLSSPAGFVSRIEGFGFKV